MDDGLQQQGDGGSGGPLPRLATFKTRELGTGASQETIADIEHALGVPLEGGYRAFLETYGWGGVEHIELLGAGGPPYLDLTQTAISERSEMEPPLPRHLIPVMNDGGGNLYCLDTTVSGEPPIVLWIHDEGVDQRPAEVARNFDSWLVALLDDLG